MFLQLSITAKLWLQFARTVECGQHHPVIADACISQDRCQKMPVKKGMVEGKSVNVLWDTGCSAVVVCWSLVPDSKLTGVEEQCVLIDGTVWQTPVTKIQVETPYFTGEATAVCMKEPLFDLIIGNVKGVHRDRERVSADFGSSSHCRQGCREASVFGGRSWRNHGNRQQESDSNSSETSPRWTTVRPKLQLLPRTVKEPVSNVNFVERNANIFGTGKPWEASPVREARVRSLMENWWLM